jgi:MYXO-CTERM domain-containing protein
MQETVGTGREPPGRQPGPGTAPLGAAGRGAAVLLVAGAAWDLPVLALDVPAWWPPVSYALLALGAATACLAVLLRMLGSRRRAAGETRRTAAALFGIGIVLLAWLLRGHAEVPPDPPLIVAQAIGVGLLALLALAARRRPPPP